MHPSFYDLPLQFHNFIFKESASDFWGITSRLHLLKFLKMSPGLVSSLWVGKKTPKAIGQKKSKKENLIKSVFVHLQNRLLFVSSAFASFCSKSRFWRHFFRHKRSHFFELHLLGFHFKRNKKVSMSCLLTDFARPLLGGWWTQCDQMWWNFVIWATLFPIWQKY